MDFEQKIRVVTESLGAGEIFCSEGDKEEWILQETARYPRGSFALIFRGNSPQLLEVLLAKRKDFQIWNLPGGGSEITEDAFEAVAREVLEETGLTVRPVYTDAFTIDMPRNTENPIGAENRPDAFSGIVCTIRGGELKLTDESSSIRWFPVDKLPDDIYERHALLIKACVNDVRNTQDIGDIIAEHALIPADILGN